ncbi:unnamed protein product [Rhizoctonia solani]|uniref:AAA+ ATPase domain-containing protein n=1 Tax=Rhizoctonia solani TaxID=456999 RepID=A0A8H2XYS3_9AGAM|nr:unnamed protein product [Rhizoctonia solani]
MSSITTEHSSLPPDSLVHDALTHLSSIFNSSASKGTSASKFNTGAVVNDPALILYCPIEGGEEVIDVTVSALASKTHASLQTIDVLKLINEQPGSFWRDMSEPRTDDGNGSDSGSGDNKATGYFKMQEPINATKLLGLIDTAISQPDSSPELECQPEEQRRIVYVRDFGFLATFAPACYHKILNATSQPKSSSIGDNEKASPSTAVILGASPLLIKGGLFQTEQSKKRARRDSSPGLFSLFMSLKPEGKSDTDKSLDDWTEGKNAEKLRNQRLHKQHEMWNNGTIIDHVHEHLKQTDISSGDSRGRSSNSNPFPTCVVVPARRDLKKERLAREKRRLELNRLQIQMALLAIGGELSDIAPLPGSGERSDNFISRCQETLVGYGAIKNVADRAVNEATILPRPSPGPTPIAWNEYCAAWSTQQERDRERANWLKSSAPSKNGSEDGSDTSANVETECSEGDDSNSESDMVDELVEKLKKEGLSPQEKRMLECLIRPAEIQTGFDSVHLPGSTIESVRTLVSLRLACPEAFRTGILKQHNMSGALLFGPPGTGKTHLAKAIAKESGARMISIKPSDILDKYVGEDEKTISALFRLARRLNPCIIFIDEVDALFATRVASKDNCSRWRTDMLTQFAQEMDGMHSSEVIVIGATNRPFDLDDAIIRRLPCRILVEIPDKRAREAILTILLKDEQLEPDVNLPDLARQTENYSGSDLKNVCIKAAFESVKDMWNVSWADRKGKKAKPNSPGAPKYDKPLPTPDNSSAQSGTPVNSRKLAKRHFELALKEIRASTSDKQSSLAELRRWNEQFGSGGQFGTAGGSRSSLPGSSRPWANRFSAGGPGDSVPNGQSESSVPLSTTGGCGESGSLSSTGGYAGSNPPGLNRPWGNRFSVGEPGANPQVPSAAPPNEQSDSSGSPNTTIERGYSNSLEINRSLMKRFGTGGSGANAPTEQYNRSDQSGITGGYGIPVVSLPGSHQPWMNKSGAGGAGAGPQGSNVVLPGNVPQSGSLGSQS